jgi:RimJ/RimL family protein N-acetyltransferase
MLERMGMRKEAHFVESIRVGGRWSDDVVYAILAREWKALRRRK